MLPVEGAAEGDRAAAGIKCAALGTAWCAPSFGDTIGDGATLFG
jgi:hypothetical protein